jgi:glycine betaine/proline transport system substrate-binding protein
LAKNPAAKRFFELVEIPIGDVNAQNLRQHNGEDKPEDIRRHAEEWIAANKAKFDSWIAEAVKAAM